MLDRCPDLQYGPGGHRHRLPPRDRGAVDGDRRGAPVTQTVVGCVKRRDGPWGAFEAAPSGLPSARLAVVHRAARRDADLPVAGTARELLADDTVAAERRLWELCRADVELLCAGPHNLGVRYLLPEVRTERFAGFHAVRAELRDAYRQLLAATDAGAALAKGGLELRTDLVFGPVLRADDATSGTGPGSPVTVRCFRMPVRRHAACANAIRACKRPRVLLSYAPFQVLAEYDTAMIRSD
ncbi:hypothetical protein ACFV7R_09315 [Streptomyces sp. NPDC059866]|uniref:hypothetical protein n=1 Tax=Streptomyces sp. NPDC059866 TaxID=3346978 RepID=UPI0036578CD1